MGRTQKSSYKPRRIRQLEREIKQIEDYHDSFTRQWPDDLDAKIYALKSRKERLVRAAILQTHIEIEGIIDILLRVKFYQVRVWRRNVRNTVQFYNRTFKEARGIFSGAGSLGFQRKIVLLRLMKIVDKRQYDDLRHLNSLRNRVGHQWMIEGVVRKGARRSGHKRHVLAYEGHNLFNPSALVEFLEKYSDLFLVLAGKL